MPSRPDIRELASSVKDAFSEMDRETLLEILTFVVKEYVAEGPPPMMLHQAETLSDLKGASFAQLIGMMQTRFDFPELQMFVVDGEQVGVRINGAIQPLLPSRTPMQDPSQAAGPGPAARAAAPQPGVRVVETGLQQRPPVGVQLPPGVQMPANAQVVDTRQAPPPSRGLSVRGAPTGGGAPAPAPAAPPAPAPAAPAAAAAPPAAPEDKKPEGGGDDASARFSLLELD